MLTLKLSSNDLTDKQKNMYSKALEWATNNLKYDDVDTFHSFAAWYTWNGFHYSTPMNNLYINFLGLDN